MLSLLPTRAVLQEGDWQNVGCVEQASGDRGPAAHLDLLDGVHDEGVLQVLHGPLHPVVEGCGPLGVLQVQLVNGLQQLLRALRVPNGVGWEGAS